MILVWRGNIVFQHIFCHAVGLGQSETKILLRNAGPTQRKKKKPATSPHRQKNFKQNAKNKTQGPHRAPIRAPKARKGNPPARAGRKTQSPEGTEKDETNSEHPTYSQRSPKLQEKWIQKSKNIKTETPRYTNRGFG